MSQFIEQLSLPEMVKMMMPAKQPFLVGITGASSSGKTTLSLALQKEFQYQHPDWKISVIQADNFIYSNAHLEANQLMSRKGFPESFDTHTFKQCLENLKKNQNFPIETPLYSQKIKDIESDKVLHIEKSDIYLIEGVNLFFKYEQFQAANYLDFCIYLDTDPSVVKERALKRFFEAYEQSKKIPAAYFEKFAGWDEKTIREHAEKLWETMDNELLKTYIMPHRSIANLILKSYTSRT